MNNKLVLIDADPFVYAAGFAAEHKGCKVFSEDGEYTIYNSKTEAKEALKKEDKTLEDVEWEVTFEIEPVENALNNFKRALTKVYNHEDFEGAEFKTFFTSDDKSNFRFKVAKTLPYKANRNRCKTCDGIAKAWFEGDDTIIRCLNSKCIDKEKDGNCKSFKPNWYKEIREYAVENFDIQVISGMEADDAIAIECEKNKDKDITIVSIDKDFWQIENVKFFNPSTEEYFDLPDLNELKLDRSKNKPKLTGKGEKWLWAQMLLGDSADNIQKIPKYGDVKVYSVLKDLSVESCRDKVKFIYSREGEKVSNNPKFFEENLKLLSLLKEPLDEPSPK